MKKLLVFCSCAVFSACANRLAGPSTVQVSAPAVITDPANSVYKQMVESYFYSPSTSTCTREGTTGSSYYKESFFSSNMEFAVMREYHGDSNCSSLLLYASKVFAFVSYVNTNAEQQTSFSLIDAQISIADANVVNSYNGASTFAISNWSLGNARSVIDRKARPTDASLTYVSGSISVYTMRKSSNLVFIDGIQYQ